MKILNSKLVIDVNSEKKKKKKKILQKYLNLICSVQILSNVIISLFISLIIFTR